MIDRLREDLRTLGATPAQTAELTAEPERAAAWISWARRTGKGIAAIMAEFRTGLEAPDIDGWYETATEPQNGRKSKAGPDHATALKHARALIRNTAHELHENDVDDEIEWCETNAKIGNGARLTEAEKDSIRRDAAKIREAWEAGQGERDEQDAKTAIGWYERRTAHNRDVKHETLKAIRARPGSTPLRKRILAAIEAVPEPEENE
jgi:hypothetical protein